MRKLAIAIAIAALTACGNNSAGSSSSGSTGAGSSSSGSTGAGSSSSGSSTGSSSASTSASSSSSGSTSASSTGSSSSSSGSTTTSSGPITGLPDKTWTWVDFPGALCRDGTPTGIGVNPSAGSNKLLIFLNGGGACFNNITCGNNPSHFDATSFQNLIGGNTNVGIFNRNEPKNPFRDWNMVFVPYCTGDVHAGDAMNVSVPGVNGTQDFVGYEDIAKYLARLVPTFPSLSEVVLTGASAGGFGAAANYTQVARAFSPVPVQMIDDSGPMMEDPYLASCLQDKVRQLWGLDNTILADCGSDCPDNTNYMLAYSKHVVESAPNRQFGLIDSTDDNVITLFFGFGLNNCSGFAQEDGGFFAAGLDDIRTKLAGDSNFGTYYFTGTDHTSLGGSTFYTRDAGIALNTWVGELADGGNGNIGP